MIVYNFVGSGGGERTAISWKRIGYEMAVAENSETLPSRFPLSSIRVSIPTDWKDEMAEITKLESKQLMMNRTGSDRGEITLSAGPADGPVTKIDASTIDHRQILSMLRNSFEARLAADQTQLWNFKVGLLAGKASSHGLSDAEINATVTGLLQLAVSAPSNVALPVETLNELAGRSRYSYEDGVKFREMLEKLKN